MRAVVLRSPGHLAVSDVDTPEPGPHEVLLRVTHTGICGTDLKIFNGTMPSARPVIMGHEIAGEVIAGEDSRIRRGTRVLVDRCSTAVPASTAMPAARTCAGPAR